MILEKDPQQEDFLQGRMLGNPYSSNEPGLGPLMRDVKNKICQGMYLQIKKKKEIALNQIFDRVTISAQETDKNHSDSHSAVWVKMHFLLFHCLDETL